MRETRTPDDRSARQSPRILRGALVGPLVVVSMLLATLMPAGASLSCPAAGFSEKRHYAGDILERMQRASTANLLIVGDSIAERWFDLPRQAGQPVDNWGASGDKPENLLWRLQQVDQRNWTTVIMVLGVNAAFRSPACKTVADGIEADIRELKRISPASKVVVFGVMPYQPGLAPSLAQIDPINMRLASDARRLGYWFVDPGNVLKQQCLNRKSCPLLIDWLHPSPAGYGVMWASVSSQAGVVSR